MVELRRTRKESYTRIEAIVDGESVSQADIWDKVMRIGEVPVRLGGIGGVCTQRAFRRRGYSRVVMEECIRVMQEDSYSLSALFGISYYYHRFGYTTALYECQASVALRDVEGAEGRYVLREMQTEDAPVVAEIYQAGRHNRTASVVRDPAQWNGFRIANDFSDRVAAWVLLDEEEIVAYLSYNTYPTSCVIAEVGYRTPEAFSSILAAAARRGLETRNERIVFTAPPDDPFIIYCQRYGSHVSANTERCGNGMVRIIDQQGLLNQLEPLFRERLQQSAYADWKGVLTWETDLGTSYTSFGGGCDVRVRLSQAILTQLLLGYRDVRDAFFETEAQVKEEYLPLLEALLPKGWPYVWWADRF